MNNDLEWQRARLSVVRRGSSSFWVVIACAIEDNEFMVDVVFSLTAYKTTSFEYAPLAGFGREHEIWVHCEILEGDRGVVE